jgi:hypothetical protein
VVPHTFEDSQEQLPSRPKAAPKCVLRVGRIGMVEVVFEELALDSFSIALDISPAWHPPLLCSQMSAAVAIINSEPPYEPLSHNVSMMLFCRKTRSSY